MIKLDKDFTFYYTLRVCLIIGYPLWLLFCLVDCKKSGDFKKAVLLPFQKW